MRPVAGTQAATLGRGADVRMAVEVPGILVRYDKKDGNYLGLIQLACGLLWYRRLHRMGQVTQPKTPHEHYSRSRIVSMARACPAPRSPRPR